MRRLIAAAAVFGIVLVGALRSADTAEPAAKPGGAASSPAGPRVQYQIPNIAGGPNSLVGLKADGTLLVQGGKELGLEDGNSIDWKDVVQIAPGWHHLLALKKDGTVQVTGDKQSAPEKVAAWTDIVAVSAGYAHSLGLKKDGTVVAAGGAWAGQCNVSDWRGVVAISAGGYHSVGVKEDGTVLATGANKYGESNLATWTNIVAVAAGFDYTVGLRSDGTLVAVGRNQVGQCNVEQWTGVVDVRSNSWGTIGLCADGTVLTTGEDNWKQQAMNGSVKDAVAVAAGEHFFIVLRPDGTIHTVGEAAKMRNGMGWDLGKTDPKAWQVRRRTLSPTASVKHAATKPASNPANAK